VEDVFTAGKEVEVGRKGRGATRVGSVFLGKKKRKNKKKVIQKKLSGEGGIVCGGCAKKETTLRFLQRKVSGEPSFALGGVHRGGGLD